MGYYTQYVLEVDAPAGHPVCDEPVAYWSNDDGDFTVRTFIDDPPEPCKWYEHEEDLVALSKKHPDVLFTLHGEGEESGDLWVQYFKGGKTQLEKAHIVFGKFDPKRLR